MLPMFLAHCFLQVPIFLKKNAGIIILCLLVSSIVLASTVALIGNEKCLSSKSKVKSMPYHSLICSCIPNKNSPKAAISRPTTEIYTLS